MQGFIVDFPVYVQNGQLLVAPGVCGITFENQGNVPVLINGSYPLSPGRSLSISAQENQQDLTRYYFSFNQTGVINPQNLLVIARQTYV